MIRRLVVAAALATAVMLTLAAARHLDPIPLGFATEHDGDVTVLTGEICPLRDGDYRFAAPPETPATILVNGQAVSGPVHLTAGAHTIMIRYALAPGATPFVLLWGRGSGPFEVVPEWARRRRKVRSLARLAAGAALSVALAVSEWIWVGLLTLIAGLAAVTWLTRVRGAIAQACNWPVLRWILAASLFLDVAGLWWGLPATWVAIELKPQYVLGGLEQHFSHGWFDAYPPVHFYVLSLAWSPLIVLSWLGRITFDGVGYTTLVVISRLVSVAMAAGIVTAACLCGTRLFGRRAGLFAAAAAALVTPFLHYAKTANVDVPYLFWWALSMVFYLALLETGAMRDYLLFAATTTLSVCTKDQAYGLYLLPPVAIVEQIWRVNRQAAVPHAFWRALTDRRLIAAALTAAVLFAVLDNVLVNMQGFSEHVRYITGPGSALYRVFEPTPAGHVALLRESLLLIAISMGWPLTAAGVIGLALALANRRLRRAAIWLLVPVVSYYLGFINVILYNYDRFVMPMCFVLAIFAGLAFERMLSLRAAVRGLAAAAIVGAFSYTVLYAGTVDVLMIEDSRYEVERWMSAHVAPNTVVSVSGLREYLPRLNAYRIEEIGTVAELRQEHPEYVVLNADYARAVPADSDWGQMIGGLEQHSLGYRRVGVFRHPAPWPWLPAAHPDLVGARQETVVFSTLRNINPTIEIFQREQ